MSYDLKIYSFSAIDDILEMVMDFVLRSAMIGCIGFKHGGSLTFLRYIFVHLQDTDAAGRRRDVVMMLLLLMMMMMMFLHSPLNFARAPFALCVNDIN